VSAFIEMADFKQQRFCIKFCFRLNKTAAETHRMLQEAFGEQPLSQARTFEWFKRITENVSKIVIRSKIYTSYYQCLAPYIVFERKKC
jgi:D-ribose pyranose/furanose isomerase RbsD